MVQAAFWWGFRRLSLALSLVRLLFSRSELSGSAAAPWSRQCVCLTRFLPDVRLLTRLPDAVFADAVFA